MKTPNNSDESSIETFRDSLETSRDCDEGNDNLRHVSKNQSIQGLFFCTAIFNLNLEQIKTILEPICIKGKFGKEICPTTGNIHYQTFITLKKKMRAEQLGKLIKAKWIKCNGSEESNIRYVSKDNEVYDFGYPKIKEKYVVKIDNFYKWQLEILEIISKPADDRTIYWYHEPKGCAGKTTFQKYLYTNFNNVIVLGGKASDMKNGIINVIQQKIDPKIVLINIPRSVEHISYTGIEEIKDMFFFSGKYEGGMVCEPNPHVIVFSNMKPRIDTMSDDRWVIVDISE